MKEVNQLSLFFYVKPLLKINFAISGLVSSRHKYQLDFITTNDSFYRWLSRGCLVVVGTFFRYKGFSANRQAKNSYIAKWPLEAAKWSGVIHGMLMDWYLIFGAMLLFRDVIQMNSIGDQNGWVNWVNFYFVPWGTLVFKHLWLRWQ